MAIFLTILTFFSTFIGGLVALKYKDRLHLILGFSAGVVLSVVAFDIFPEIINLIKTGNFNARLPMLSFILGFLIFHIGEKLLIIHHSGDSHYKNHTHP